MDKPLDDKGKTPGLSEQGKTAEVKPANAPATPGLQEVVEAVAPFEAHEDHLEHERKSQKEAAASARPLITRQTWSERNDQGTWMDDPKSRLAIRMFSRGVLGAAFFASGGQLAKKWMKGYDVAKPFAQQTNKNPLSFIAKLIDSGVGKPIEAAVTAVAGKEAGLAAVRFRPTYYGRMPGNFPVRGRSLGDEVVNITFDFFCASVGDAWGRDIAGWFDPNVKKDWTDAKGNINFPDAIKTALKSVTRYVTYNGGEDWAVSIPYAYFMKGQRALLSKAAPGFQYDFDRSINGGSFKIKDGKIAGNYHLPGIIDLQNRFTVYNIGTLMYREAYDYVGNLLAGKPHKIYGAPDAAPDEKRGVLDRAGDVVKWAARSAVKGVVIMTPAVPFFWITRTPQTKYRAAFIDPQQGIMGTVGGNGTKGHDAFTANEHFRGPEDIEYIKYNPNEPYAGNVGKAYDGFSFKAAGTMGEFEPGLAQHGDRYGSANNFDPFAHSFGPVDNALNAIGKKNAQAAHYMDKPAAWLDRHTGHAGQAFSKAMGVSGFSGLTRPFVYASASYTPYMYAKAEFANLWDNGKMDMAAERMIDGAAKLNWNEFKAGAREVWNTILYKPLPDAMREKEGQRRSELDTSPPDVFLKTSAQQQRDKERQQQQKEIERQNATLAEADRIRAEREAQAQAQAQRTLHVDRLRKDIQEKKAQAQMARDAKSEAQKQGVSWQDRIVSGPPREKDEAKAETTPAGKSYADQEAMRKALEELTPPTNSIN